MLSEKQKKLFRFAQVEEGGAIISVGAIRSGKTFASALAFGLYCMSQKEPRNHLILGRKLRVIENEILPHIKNLAKLIRKQYTMQHIKNLCTVGDQKFFLVACNDQKSYERLQGLTIHSALMDEATLMTENFFETAMSRLSFDNSKVWATCNPSFPLHFIKKKWIDQGKFYDHIQFTFEDNPVLEEGTKQRYRDMFEGVFARRMVDGLWATGEGLVYTKFRISKQPRGRRVRTDIGIDYGTASTTAFVVVHTILRGDGEKRRSYCYHVREVVTIQGSSTMQNKTDAELADELFKLADKWKPTTVVLDHAAASFRAELLRDHRRRFRVRVGGKDVVSGIRRVGTALAHGVVTVDPDCKDLIDELNSYCWDPTKEDTVLKENDHCCDAMRYALLDKLKLDYVANAKLPEGF